MTSTVAVTAAAASPDRSSRAVKSAVRSCLCHRLPPALRRMLTACLRTPPTFSLPQVCLPLHQPPEQPHLLLALQELPRQAGRDDPRGRAHGVNCRSKSMSLSHLFIWSSSAWPPSPLGCSTHRPAGTGSGGPFDDARPAAPLPFIHSACTCIYLYTCITPTPRPGGGGSASLRRRHNC